MSALVASAGIVAAYLAVVRMIRWLALPAAVSPVLVTALGIGALLAATGTPLARFAAMTMPLHLLLAPAIVALGAGVHANRATLRRAGRPLALAVTAGTASGVASAVLLARALGLGPLLTAATVTRTVSTPFAVLVQTRVGGPVSLAASLAVATGVVGAVLLPPLLKALRLGDAATLGTAAGVAAHLVGTDAVGRRDPLAAAFAGAGLVGAGILVALVVPPLWPWLAG
ncbi:MAG: LrgB family protein [Sphingomonadaceae bacterium]|nr:LrgB family protein [Sphingomonadaceae bacterium]